MVDSRDLKVNKSTPDCKWSNKESKSSFLMLPLWELLYLAVAATKLAASDKTDVGIEVQSKL